MRSFRCCMVLRKIGLTGLVAGFEQIIGIGKWTAKLSAKPIRGSCFNRTDFIQAGPARSMGPS